MLGIDVSNYRRNNEKNKVMHCSREADTSTIISSSSSFYAFEGDPSKNLLTPPNSPVAFANQVQANSDVENFKKSALDATNLCVCLNALEINENGNESCGGSSVDVELAIKLEGEKGSKSDVLTEAASGPEVGSFFASEQQLQISESLFQSNLENLSHYDTFDTDLQRRSTSDFMISDMTSTDNLDFTAHHQDSSSVKDDDSLKKGDLCESDTSQLNNDDSAVDGSNFSFAEDVENFEKMLMQSPQVNRNKRRVDEVKEDLKEDDGRVRKLNKKGHNVNFSDKLVTVYSCVLDPWSEVCKGSTENLLASYQQSCKKNSVQPALSVVAQLKQIADPSQKVPVFFLKDLALDSAQVDSLEEVFRRVRMERLVIETALLDEQASVSMFELLSFYEPCDSLVISACKNLGTRDCQAFSQFLKQTTSLYSLEMKHLVVPENSYNCFIKGFQMCGSLQSLSLHNSVSSGRHLSLLVNAIQSSESIKVVSLSDNQLCSSDAGTLCTLLREHQCLQFLDVSNNFLMDQGATHIFDMLSSNHPSLRHLSLANNKLSKFSLPVLSRSLKHTKTLQSLVLDHNKLLDDGVVRLKDGLALNNSLTHLSLQAVGVSGHGIASLSDFISGHPTLQHLNLHGNQLGEDALMSLSRSLSSNLTLTRVDLDKSEIVEANCARDENEAIKDGSSREKNTSSNGVAMTNGTNERKSKLFEEIEGYIHRNRERHTREETPPSKSLDSDSEGHSSYDSLPTYTKVSGSSDKNNLPYLLSLSLSSLTSSSSSLSSPISSSSSASSLSAALSASLSSLSSLSSSTSIATSHFATSHLATSQLSNKTIAESGIQASTNNSNNDCTKDRGTSTLCANKESKGVPNDGLPSYQEAVKQLHTPVPVIVLNAPTKSPPITTTSTASPLSLSTRPHSSPVTLTPTTNLSSSSSPSTSPLLRQTAPLQEVRVVSSPRSKKKFRVSRTSSSSFTLSPTRPTPLASPESLLKSPSSLSSSPSSSNPSLVDYSSSSL